MPKATTWPQRQAGLWPRGTATTFFRIITFTWGRCLRPHAGVVYINTTSVAEAEPTFPRPSHRDVSWAAVLSAKADAQS